MKKWFTHNKEKKKGFAPFAPTSSVQYVALNLLKKNKHMLSLNKRRCLAHNTVYNSGSRVQNTGGVRAIPPRSALNMARA